MLGYLSADIICSKKQTVFREHSLRKTVCFSEQIMSADKYPSIFSHQVETIDYIFDVCLASLTRIFSCLFVFILGMSVLYMLFLAFALFQTREDFRKILFFFDPTLELEGPDTKVSC